LSATLLVPKDPEAAEERLRRQIENGKDTLSRIRWGVGVGALAFAVSLGVVSGVAWANFKNELPGHHYLCRLTFDQAFYLGILAFFWYGKVVVLCLAPMADDIRVTRAVVLAYLFLCCLQEIGWMDVFYPHPWRDWEKLNALNILTVSLTWGKTLILAVYAVWAMARPSAASMQRAMWRAVALWVALSIVRAIADWCTQVVHCGKMVPGCYTVPAQLMVLAMALLGRWRKGMQAALNRAFESQSSRRAAAGVAGLVGNSSAREALMLAGARFRSIRLEQLEFEDIRDNTPAPRLFGMSQPERFLGCDAFVSHSWHDDPDAKWASLQRWRRRYIQLSSHEPAIWFDKCCIDQRNIEADLRCLPIFLSGCKYMVVFCGRTYLKRLWCIMELFTFVHIGRSVDRIIFEPLLRAGHEEDDLDELEETFQTFDATLCDCFSRQDKDRLLGIIEAAFGDMASFNHIVKTIFYKARWSRRMMKKKSTSPDLPARSKKESRRESNGIRSGIGSGVSSVALAPRCATPGVEAARVDVESADSRSDSRDEETSSSVEETSSGEGS